MRQLRGKMAPYLLSLPSWVYLLIFFVIPFASMLGMAVADGNPLTGYVMSDNFQEIVTAFVTYQDAIYRSFWYGLASTVITLLLAYPTAYWITFYGGRHKSTFLFLVIVPFFVTFVIRVLAWEFILSDQGFILGPLKSLGLLPVNFHILSTQWAVIGGLVYSSFAYYVLPLYVVLEKLDRRLLRAASDLYASPVAVFRKVVLPLSASGVFAGFLLVFVTNTGDFVNAALLGGPGTYMVGNIIQDSFFVSQDYPMASSLSCILMFALLIAIILYSKAFGVDKIQEYAA